MQTHGLKIVRLQAFDSIKRHSCVLTKLFTCIVHTSTVILQDYDLLQETHRLSQYLQTDNTG